tara:strand:- start:613 stop:1200 length:588 start_codon:yes stop_codon:yes gene_type:complete
MTALLTTAEIKEHLRISTTDTTQDAMLALYADASVEEAGKFLGMNLETGTVIKKFDNFVESHSIRGLPSKRSSLMELRNPVTAITSITYIDSNGDSQTLASTEYRLTYEGEVGRHARIVENFSKTFPSVHFGLDVITVTYVSGYTALTVPNQIKAALLLMIGDLYENREDASTYTVSKIPNDSIVRLMPFRCQNL